MFNFRVIEFNFAAAVAANDGVVCVCVRFSDFSYIETDRNWDQNWTLSSALPTWPKNPPDSELIHALIICLDSRFGAQTP